jgi:hypothetical protein
MLPFPLPHRHCGQAQRDPQSIPLALAQQIIRRIIPNQACKTTHHILLLNCLRNSQRNGLRIIAPLVRNDEAKMVKAISTVRKYQKFPYPIVIAGKRSATRNPFRWPSPVSAPTRPQQFTLSGQTPRPLLCRQRSCTSEQHSPSPVPHAARPAARLPKAPASRHRRHPPLLPLLGSTGPRAPRCSVSRFHCMHETPLALTKAGAFKLAPMDLRRFAKSHYPKRKKLSTKML